MFIDHKTLFSKPEGIQTKWASPENPKAEKGKAAQSGDGRKGSACFPLRAGESRVLAEERDISGTVYRMWITIGERDITMLRGLRMDFYWDGCSKPAVSSPIGDFFGTGLGRIAPFQSALFSSPEGRSFNCTVPMPFRKGMKIVVTNESTRDVKKFFYEINYTIGDNHNDDVLYFHAHYRRENPTTIQKDYEILPRISGSGRYLGCNIGVIANRELYFNSWWGEGEVKIYLDGDMQYPTLSGTGTEDYIGTAWGQGQYDHLFQGCHIADHEKLEYCFYRYHISDPVYFDRDILVTIQQIGCWLPDTRTLFYYNDSPIYSREMEKLDFSKSAGASEYGLFERRDDWSSCVYFYLNSPENSLPEIDPVEKRIG